MPDARTKPQSTLISLPVFWQVLGLTLAVLVLSICINTLIVLKAPDPPMPGYSIADAAAALKGGEIRLRNGQVLVSTTSAKAPDFLRSPVDGGPPRRLQDTLAGQIADALHVAHDRVQVRMADHMMWRHRDEQRVETRVFVMRQSAFPDGPPNDVPGSQEGPRERPQQGPPQDGPREVTQVTVDRGPPVGGPMMQMPQDLSVPPFSVAWKQVDGSYRVIVPPKTLIAPWQARLLLGFGLTAVVVLPLAWLLARNLSRPIAAFSDAAARLGFEADSPPLLAFGPREVRQAAEVLNAMQARIKKQVESRTALMGAIAHDLKTPLARMRLRIEDLAEPTRGRLSQDIAHMDGLIKSAMSFTGAHKLADSLRPLDLSALVEALNDDLAAVCALEPPLIEADIMVRGDSVALKRIVTNLVENACRYAGGCRLKLSRRGGQAELIVSDNGPGLPPGELEAVFEPFYRVETSRNRDTGGAGLGLSVARALTEAQGATLTLHNRYAGAEVAGCEARLVMPCYRQG